MNTPVTPESLLQQIGQIQHMERGALCIMRQGATGPYYSHQTWEAGKNLSRYVPREQVPGLQEAIAGSQQFQQLTDQYAQLMIEKSRAERAAGAKKKTPIPSSSWPKSRKSKT